MDFILISLLNGTIYGLLLFMVSAGLTLVFGMMGILNFAHASFYMVGAYIGYMVSASTNFWLGLILAPIGAGFLGIVVEWGLLRKVRSAGHTLELLLTFGLYFLFEEIVRLVFGSVPVPYRVPEYLSFPVFNLGGMDYPFYRLFIGIIAIAMFIFIFLLLGKTRFGIVVRAAVHRPEMVAALGHNVSVIFSLMFAVGVGMAGLAGAVAGAFFPTSPNMASELGIIVFVVVVVGGLGSLKGAFFASLLIGIFTTVAAGLNWSLGGIAALVGLGSWAQSAGGVFNVELRALAGMVPYALMLLILLFRPSGLFGEKQ